MKDDKKCTIKGTPNNKKKEKLNILFYTLKGGQGTTIACELTSTMLASDKKIDGLIGLMNIPGYYHPSITLLRLKDKISFKKLHLNRNELKIQYSLPLNQLINDPIIE